MDKPFDYFVIFAEMRTGSNFLEVNLNEFKGLCCYGEAYNTHFIGYPNKTDLLGITQQMREADPISLIAAMKTQTSGLPGFRFFHSHDARVLEHCLPDARCAKIILTRNPVDSYVSWKIARVTDQWKLTNVKKRRGAKISFSLAEFEAQLTALQTFQEMLLKRLQAMGQTAFYIGYEDISNVDVLNGLAQYLGVEEQIESISKTLKPQNPGPLRDKVRNFDEMETALAGIDYFDLNRTPNFEPRRGPVVPGYIAAAKAPLLYLPIKCGPELQVRQWLAALDGGGALLGGFNQKTLRQWKRQHTGHRSFTVIRHPVARAHAAFCDYILKTGEGTYSGIRETLRKVYKLPIPRGGVGKNYDLSAHRAAFKAFLDFLKLNLQGQTGIRVDTAWISQVQILLGFGQFALPDMVLREEQLETGLAQLAAQVGFKSVALPLATDDYPFPLNEIYDQDIEAAARAAYPRDYLMFGFSDWGG